MLDRSPLLAEHLPDAWLPAEGADLTRTHHFKIYSGRVDGTGDGWAAGCRSALFLTNSPVLVNLMRLCKLGVM